MRVCRMRMAFATVSVLAGAGAFATGYLTSGPTAVATGDRPAAARRASGPAATSHGATLSSEARSADGALPAAGAQEATPGGVDVAAGDARGDRRRSAEGSGTVSHIAPAAGRSPHPRAPLPAAAGGEPRVAKELAFLALRYVGADPAAEKTWLRAIGDPNQSPSDRSDLIEDLNDEGYTDNDSPGQADLPLILARLELVERLAPYAMDAVNADAFEEAYKDLLEMYVRLAGGARR